MRAPAGGRCGYGGGKGSVDRLHLAAEHLDVELLVGDGRAVGEVLAVGVVGLLVVFGGFLKILQNNFLSDFRKILSPQGDPNISSRFQVSSSKWLTTSHYFFWSLRSKFKKNLIQNLGKIIYPILNDFGNSPIL